MSAGLHRRGSGNAGGVTRPDSSDDPAPRTRIVLRPVGSPLPLGFFAFGVGVLLTGLLELRALPVADSHQVAVLLLTFTGPLELLAAVLAFLARDAGAATSLGVFGATWVSTGVSMLLAAPGARSPVTGAFSLALSAVLLALAISSRPGKPALSVLLLLAAARFVTAGLYDLLGMRVLQWVAGGVSMAIVVVSIYGGLALLLEDGQGRIVLPTGRRGRARQSLEGGLGAQLAQLESEAGVRNQL